MTATLSPTPAEVLAATEADLYGSSVTRLQLGVLGVFAAVVAVALTVLLNPFVGVAVGGVAYLVTSTGLSFTIEGRRKAINRLVGALIVSSFLMILLPLISVIYTVVSEGSARFDADFFTSTMRNVLGEGGGAKHAIYGTLIITGIATAIAAPLGLLVAIYLVEYGRGRMARSVTAMVDVMTGIPSIVAGLFAYALMLKLRGPEQVLSGLSGGIALSVLMIPVVIRTSEEMLRLVPNELREAAYGLGVPKWKTVVKIVLPTSIAGILTGITLAIARVIGETAPLLIVAGLTDDINTNPADGRMTTLPVYAYYQYVQPGRQVDFSLERSWAASLTLVLIVALLFLVARILSKVLQPKGLR